METVLAGATAFITGGAQGIGLAIAGALADKRMSVALADVNAEALDRARLALEPRTAVQTYVLDVRDRRAFADVADKVEAELGPVALLFNNAGIAGGCPVTQMTYERWDWMLGVNLQGVVNGIQTFVPRMLERQSGGYIVNTSSGAGLVNAGTGFLYTTSKFAVVGLSEALNLELAPFGIGVSVLCPGPVATNIVQNTQKLDPTRAGKLDPRHQAALDASTATLNAGTSPERVAELVLDAIATKRLHILTDDLIRPLLLQRAEMLMCALPGVDGSGHVAQAANA